MTLYKAMKKEKLNERKFEILEELEKEDINETQKKEYEKELSNIIIKLARIK